MTKKFFAVLAMICLLLTGCGGEKNSPPAKEKTTIGVITHLNVSEVEYNEFMTKLEESYRPVNHAEYKYFDKMNDMQMALDAKKIDMMSTYQCVSNYMIKRKDGMEILPSEKFLSDSFCFAVRNDDTALKDELNTTIKAMVTDGTLKNLVQKYIVDIKPGENPPAVPITHIDGAETIKVAVTGDLPPLDMILPDGTPAGFSTAVLAEVSRRIEKNIELVSVDSGARAATLSSKSADVIFWVSVPKDSTLIPTDIDSPEDILLSDPYYEDVIVHVGLK